MSIEVSRVRCIGGWFVTYDVTENFRRLAHGDIGARTFYSDVFEPLPHTMEVVEDDIIQRGYRLTGEASRRFVEGGFTHLHCDGVTTAARVVGGVVYIDDEVIL